MWKPPTGFRPQPVPYATGNAMNEASSSSTPLRPVSTAMWKCPATEYRCDPERGSRSNVQARCSTTSRCARSPTLRWAREVALVRHPPSQVSRHRPRIGSPSGFRPETNEDRRQPNVRGGSPGAPHAIPSWRSRRWRTASVSFGLMGGLLRLLALRHTQLAHQSSEQTASGRGSEGTSSD